MFLMLFLIFNKDHIVYNQEKVGHVISVSSENPTFSRKQYMTESFLVSFSFYAFTPMWTLGNYLSPCSVPRLRITSHRSFSRP